MFFVPAMNHAIPNSDYAARSASSFCNRSIFRRMSIFRSQELLDYVVGLGQTENNGQEKKGERSPPTAS